MLDLFVLSLQTQMARGFVPFYTWPCIIYLNLLSKKRLRDFCVCFVLTDGRCDTSVPPPQKVAVVTYPVSVVA